MKNSLDPNSLFDINGESEKYSTPNAGEQIFSNYGGEDLDDDMDMMSFEPAPLSDMRSYNYSVPDAGEEWAVDLDSEKEASPNPHLSKKVTGYGFIILLASGMFFHAQNLNDNANIQIVSCYKDIIGTTRANHPFPRPHLHRRFHAFCGGVARFFFINN